MAHHDALTALRDIDNFFKMNEGLIGDPDYYLGAKLRKMTLKNGVEAWAMSSSKYALAAVANAVNRLKSRGLEHMMPKSGANPFKGGYKPAMGLSPEVDAEQATYVLPVAGRNNRFPRASALLWRTLEEWIVDHYVTQYNQRLDEWMNAHTRQ